MTRKAPKAQQTEQVFTPDFALAVRLFRNDIKPAQAKVGEYAQEQSTAYKAIKKNAHVDPAAARLAFRLDGMEENKRDDFLRSLRGLLHELKIFMPLDMLDMAAGAKPGESPIPTGARKPKMTLVTVPKPPAGDTDLSDGDTDKSGVDKAKEAADLAERTHGVLDAKTGEWLVDGETEGWSNDPTEATRFKPADAEKRGSEYKEPEIAAAPIDTGE
jgi:hypothetical protein